MPLKCHWYGGILDIYAIDLGKALIQNANRRDFCVHGHRKAEWGDLSGQEEQDTALSKTPRWVNSEKETEPHKILRF